MENKMVENQTKSLYEEFIDIAEGTVKLIEKKKKERNAKYKACVSKLNDYKNIDAKIENLSLYRQDLINDNEENLKEENLKKIEVIEYKIRKLEREKRRIDLVKEILNKEELQILELRYLGNQKLSWKEISNILRIEKSWLFVIRNRMLDKFCEFMFINYD